MVDCNYSLHLRLHPNWRCFRRVSQLEMVWNERKRTRDVSNLVLVENARSAFVANALSESLKSLARPAASPTKKERRVSTLTIERRYTHAAVCGLRKALLLPTSTTRGRSRSRHTCSMRILMLPVKVNLAWFVMMAMRYPCAWRSHRVFFTRGLVHSQSCGPAGKRRSRGRISVWSRSNPAIGAGTVFGTTPPLHQAHRSLGPETARATFLCYEEGAKN